VLVPIVHYFPFVAGGLLVFLLLVLALLILRRDRTLRRAVKLSQQGQSDQAIAIVRQRIAEKGETGERLNVLGVLLITRPEPSPQQYQEALDLFDRAERLGGEAKALTLNNQAMALRKLGRIDEALAKLKLACAKQPRNFTWAVNQADLLAELGRVDEAHDELDRAEALIDLMPPVGTKPWREQVDAVRRKLPNAHGFEVVPTAKVAEPADDRGAADGAA
jgi:tetratricopeptide (TPR) repeat protein